MATLSFVLKLGFSAAMGLAACSFSGSRNASDVFLETKVARLAKAACDDDREGVAAAARQGGDPNSLGKDGYTPLMWALDCPNMNGIDALISAGANPNFKTPDRSYSVEDSVRMGYSPPHPLHFYGFTSVYYAASNSEDTDALKLLLARGGDPSTYNSADQDIGPSALEAAMDIGFAGKGWENYYALLDAGANVNASGSSGSTVAVHAAIRGN